MNLSKQTWIGLALVAIGAFLFIGCQYLPALQGDVAAAQAAVAADQQAAMEAAESGNVVRLVFASLSSGVGALLLALRGIKRFDAKNFSGTVNGRKVEASEDEVVALVESARTGQETKTT